MKIRRLVQKHGQDSLFIVPVHYKIEQKPIHVLLHVPLKVSNGPLFKPHLRIRIFLCIEKNMLQRKVKSLSMITKQLQ